MAGSPLVGSVVAEHQVDAEGRHDRDRGSRLKARGDQPDHVAPGRDEVAEKEDGCEVGDRRTNSEIGVDERTRVGEVYGYLIAIASK